MVPLTKSVSLPALAVCLLLAVAVMSCPARAQSAAGEGQKLALDRSKGDCLTCHEIKGGNLAGNVGPALTDTIGGCGG